MESTSQDTPSTVREIQSMDDLNDALAALTELDAQESQAIADMELKIAEVRDSFKDRFLVTMGEAENEPLDQVRTDLMLQVEKYCTDHRTELLNGKKKSVQLTHGTIGWRDGTFQVYELPQTKAQARNGVLLFVLALLATALNGAKKIFKKAALSDLVKVSVVWDKQQLIKQFDGESITASELKRAGLMIEKSKEKFYVKAKSEAVD